jgi:phosphoesterase RecJ-like protein
VKKIERHKEEVGRVVGSILTANSVVLTTHEGPDGDGVGAMIGLAIALKRRRKSVHMIVPSSVPRRFCFLDCEKAIRVLSKKSVGALRGAELVLLVDCCEMQRTLDVAKHVGGKEVLAIDHHPKTEGCVDGLIAEDYSSVGELVLDLLEEMGVTITKDIAFPLYCAILFDTHEFRFTRNDPAVFDAARRLVEAGADAEEASRRLFASTPMSAMLLQARVLQNAKLEERGALVWSFITKDMLDGIRVDQDDLRRPVTMLSEMQGVKIAVLFKELARRGLVKVSIRSPGKIRINDIAQMFGGGGHPFAAGVDMDGSLEDVEARVLPLLRNRVRGHYP